jgi:hypothetical protein
VPAKRGWTKVEVKILVGAEAWVMLRHDGRYFKLPLDAPMTEMLRGVADGWDIDRIRRPGAPTNLEEWRRWRVIGEGPTARSVRS